MATTVPDAAKNIIEEEKQEDPRADAILNDRDSAYNKDPEPSQLNVVAEDPSAEESPDKVKDELIDKING